MSTTQPMTDTPTAGLLRLLMRLDAEAVESDEQRLFTRRAVHGPVSLWQRTEQFVAGRPPMTGWALDLSEHGLGMLLESPIEVGSNWLVDLESLADRSLRLVARVIYCHRVLSRTWRVGALFQFPRAEG
ncbi:MAG: PilZ domain-containing protein [Phycisphaeraceae bacterium]|nr:PilZ domain-containing protein [Phycisphaeraceae bacterium]